MINRAVKTFAAAVLLLAGGTAGCTDLTTYPKDRVAGGNIFNEPGAYKSFLAKLYAGLAVTGMRGEGGAGEGDVGGIDEGFSQYVRQWWQLQELPTDEAVIAWEDKDLPEMNSQEWGTANQFIQAMYYRIFFQVALANEFLRETTDAKLSERNESAQVRAEVAQYRAEARFLRALSYWHAIDLFGSVPFVVETDNLGANAPPQRSRAEVFQFIESELNEVRTQLPAAGANQYGRASQAAADMVLAKLYLNAQVYTGTARWTEAAQAAERVIASGKFQLDDRYQDIFLADNHTSPEMIFAVPFDGRNTRTYGGTTFLIHASVGNQMNASDYGIDGGWWGLRAKPQLVAKFPGGAASADRRAAIFYTNGQSLNISAVKAFEQGYTAPKFRNVTSTGARGSDAAFTDTDFPMFRLADAYLMYAEAVLRGGGGNAGTALNYVNLIRRRAYGNTSGDITAAQLTLDFILDERARELFWEAHRRTDLVRYGRFTGGSYIWAFKGSRTTAAGTATPETRNLYPIPASDLATNPNLKQNPGYTGG
ncbi:MAG TPA: RagB/SusD family nutrient uptake outer membrane protein [Longimicrobium sp.]|nr:RagB/SusD family nutrient uptake outer membrane protein [Longimicrobium sp.]